VIGVEKPLSAGLTNKDHNGNPNEYQGKNAVLTLK
jgi:hypothetical protein